jgi:hypothetical protein
MDRHGPASNLSRGHSRLRAHLFQLLGSLRATHKSSLILLVSATRKHRIVYYTSKQLRQLSDTNITP